MQLGRPFALHAALTLAELSQTVSRLAECSVRATWDKLVPVDVPGEKKL